MSSEYAIKVEKLSKCYQIYNSPRDRLKQSIVPRLKRVFRRKATNYYREFWALRDVSFEVNQGETVGIIGRNGSGKSTLLQMICGTLTPTSGNIYTQGRIAALLELGSGFNQEFTGRENIYLNAAVLGMNRADVEQKLDAILAFADIGQFVHQPVKTYSSGMVVRLAFAVAINVDPQILVVDEALSVGDELFQRKCFSRIDALRSAGTTILFVSHSGGTVVELCDRALLLDGGERLAIGTPKRIVGRYQKLLYAPAERHEAIKVEIREEIDRSSGKTLEPLSIPIRSELQTAGRDEELKDSHDPSLNPTSTIAYESNGAVIESPAIHTPEGELVNNLTRGRRYRYRYRVRFDRPASNVRFGMLIKTTSGVEMGGGVSASSYHTSLPYVKAGSIFSVCFEFSCLLNPGVYFLNAGVVGDLNRSETYLHRLIDAAMFRVLSEQDLLSTGIVDFACVPNFFLEEK